MNNFLKKLELDLIFEELSSYAIMPSTRSKIAHINPLNDINKIRILLEETYEALNIIERLGRAPINIVSDYVNIIKVASKGGKLDGLELYETFRLFSTIKENYQHLDFLEKENIICSHYKEYVEQLYIDDDLDAKIKKSIDEDGYILDDASPTLKSIRNKLRSMEARIKAKLQELVSKEASKLSQTTISIENGESDLVFLVKIAKDIVIDIKFNSGEININNEKLTRNEKVIINLKTQQEDIKGSIYKTENLINKLIVYLKT